MTTDLQQAPPRVDDGPVEVACKADWLPRREKRRVMRRLRRELGRRGYREMLRQVAERCT